MYNHWLTLLSCTTTDLPCYHVQPPTYPIPCTITDLPRYRVQPLTYPVTVYNPFLTPLPCTTTVLTYPVTMYNHYLATLFCTTWHWLALLLWTTIVLPSYRVQQLTYPVTMYNHWLTPLQLQSLAYSVIADNLTLTYPVTVYAHWLTPLPWTAADLPC